MEKSYVVNEVHCLHNTDMSIKIILKNATSTSMLAATSASNLNN